jgi:hypothetical protein
MVRGKWAAGVRRARAGARALAGTGRTGRTGRAAGTGRAGRAAALVALVALAGCGSFEDPTRVIDLRVLAMQANPPEVVVDFDPENPAAVAPQLDANPVTVRVLVADPAEDRRLAWDMVVCPPTDDRRCDDPDDPRMAIASGVVDDPETAAVADVPTASFVVGLDVLQASLSADSLAGFGGIAVQVQLRVWPEGEDPEQSAATVYAAKQVVYAPRDPAERVANSNPVLAALDVDGDASRSLAPGRCADPAAPRLEVEWGAEVGLVPVEPLGARETYVLPTFDGSVRRITENLRYAWYASAGSWSSGSSGGPIDAFGNAPPLDSTWRAPEEPDEGFEGGGVSLWLVQRDERGGASWTEYCVVVR